jgi:iron complex outermembrane receptor protein
MMIFKYRYIIYVIFFFCLVNQRIVAQPSNDSLQVYNLKDTIVVVADRFKHQLNNLPNTYQIIPGQQVESISRHSALELVDMVFPSSYMLEKMIIGYGVGVQGAGTINMRGQGGKPNTGMLVLLNGHPDFMGIFGHPLPDVYGLDDVQQVEILAGPSSSVFGSQAMGGIINIKSGPDYKRMAKVSMAAGSYKTYNIGVNFAKMIDNNGIFATIRHKHTDGHIDQSSFSSYHIQAGWQYQMNPNWQISVQGRYVPYEFDDPARTSDRADLGIYAKLKRGTGEIILENSGELIQGSTQIYGNWGHHRFYDGFESKDHSYGLSSYQYYNLYSNINFAVGGDLIFYGGRAENNYIPAGIVNDDKHELTTAGAYGLVMVNPFNNLNLKLGLRYQYNSLPLQQWAPVAGLNFSLSPLIKINVNYQSGFRFPTLNELYLFPISNPELKNELIESVEFGLGFHWSDLSSLRLTVYRNDVENIIQSPPPPPVIPYKNSGMAKQTGFETQLNHRPFPGLEVQFSYSYLDPDQLTSYNPRNQVKIFLNYFLGRFRSTLFGRYVDRLYAENNGESRLKDYALANLIFSYDLMSWEFHIKFLNLFDRSYFVQPEYPAPDFHFIAGFDYRL